MKYGLFEKNLEIIDSSKIWAANENKNEIFFDNLPKNNLTNAEYRDFIS